MWETIFFYLFAAMALGLGLVVITHKNPVVAAVALVGNLFAIAALYALLQAQFLAVIQVMVYAGAIMVLFVFVIMLLNLQPHELGHDPITAKRAFAGVLVASLVALLLYQAAAPSAGTTAAMAPMPADNGSGTIESVGALLFGPFVLPFEVISILLLAAMLGAVAIAKKELW